MLSNCQDRITLFVFVLVAGFFCARGHAQSALLMEEPYGFFGALNPTGHNAIYFERICAETPVKVRPCEPGELGAVIARYQGVAGYDWVAVPLIPYLYSVENAADVPAHVDRETVTEMRSRYREEHLEGLGANLSPGNLVHGGWTQLLGAAYERRIYAFRFRTTEAQDDALIEKLNAGPNRTRFNLLFNNCADFARVVLNSYFPRTFGRSIFPDAGMTTPKQITYKLLRYARKHPEAQLTVFEIPQIPGYRRRSHSAKTVDESFVTTIYAIPIALDEPLSRRWPVCGLPGARPLPSDYKEPTVLGPDKLSALTAPSPTQENSAIAGVQAPGAVGSGSMSVPTATGATPTAASANSDLPGTSAANE
jgi:hypothetical protein